ncbi:NAD-dependent epimerase/dehydratase family protein [Amycolatopsis sp. NPDC004378]
MDIVGAGFLARHLAPLAGRHPDSVVLAAGVTAVASATEADFRRERDLVVQSLARCRSTGKKLVFLSTASTALYNAAPAAGSEHDAVRPSTPYGLHKYSLERTIARSAVDYLVLRLAHVTGPHQKPYQLVPSLTSQVRRGTVQIYRGATRDLIDVDDFVTIVDKLLTAGVTGDVVNVASGVSIPVERIVDRLEAGLGIAAHRTTVHSVRAHAVSIDKLRGLVAGLPNFRPDYPLAVIDRYLAAAGLLTAPDLPVRHRPLAQHH